MLFDFEGTSESQPGWKNGVELKIELTMLNGRAFQYKPYRTQRGSCEFTQCKIDKVVTKDRHPACSNGKENSNYIDTQE